MYLYFLCCFSSVDLLKGRGITLSSATRVRCLSPPSFSGLLPAFLSHSHSHSHDGQLVSLRWVRSIPSSWVSRKGRCCPLVPHPFPSPPPAGSLRRPGFGWEAGVLGAAANLSCICRLPGSSVPGGTNSSAPVGLLWPPSGGSPCQEALSLLEVGVG